MKFISKIHSLDLTGIILIIILASFTLPTFGYWRLPEIKQTKNLAESILTNYQHPAIPQINIGATLPTLTTTNYILIDSNTNQILLSQNPHGRIYPASTTKLATVLTALNIYPLDEVVTVSQKYDNGKNMSLSVGEKISVRSLISALLIYSANDAAYNLAAHHLGGVPGFIAEMNLITQRYNLTDTHFVNFDGIHDPNHYSSVYDLSQFARLAIKNQIVLDLAKTKSLTVTDVSGSIVHNLTTTNELLGKDPEIEGLKTGWTPEASGCFVGLINLNGHYLISVVAQSSDRFTDTEKILTWAKQSITWQPYN